jgi:hypothetical protein
MESPAWEPPPEPKSEDQRHWYQKPLQTTVIGVVLAAVIGLAVTKLTKDSPPKPPNSDQATVNLVTPAHNAPRYRIDGAGWYGDNAVELRVPAAIRSNGQVRSFYFKYRTVVRGGSFSYFPAILGLEFGKQYTLIVRGEQSGHETRETFTIPWSPTTTRALPTTTTVPP